MLKSIREFLAYNNSTLKKLGFSNDEINRIIGRLVEKQSVRYAYAKKKKLGEGRKSTSSLRTARKPISRSLEIIRYLAGRKEQILTREDIKGYPILAPISIILIVIAA